MADQNVAETKELTSYIPRRSNRNRAVIDQPQGEIEAVKVVTMGNRCSSCTNCACAFNIACEIGRSTAGWKATHGSSKSTADGKENMGPSKHQTRRRTGNQVTQRKIEVITLSDTDSDEDATTEEWARSSSSEDDIQVIEERIIKRSSARQYHEMDKPTGSLVR